MKIKLLDSNFGDQPGLSPFIKPKHDFARDCENPDLVICTDGRCYSEDLSSYSCTKVAWLIEPPIVNGENHINMTKNNNSEKFDFVYTYNRWFEDKINNFRFQPHGGTWLREEDCAVHEKTKLCSMIYSDKKWNAGHNQRSRAHNLLNEQSINCDFYGSGAGNFIDFKITGLKDYMFSIAMENEAPPYLFSPNNDYFSEKIIDCFLSGTIPIYYGNPRISEYFNSDGIIIITDVDQLPEAMNKATADFYNSNKEAVLENFEKAKEYKTPEDLIVSSLNG
jgi:hypothetical protein